jgi:hypothetical protein
MRITGSIRSRLRLPAVAIVFAGTLIWVAAAFGGGGVGLPGSGHHHRHHHFHRNAFLPPDGRAFHGVSETIDGVHGVHVFARQVGAHPAVVQDFFHWGTPLGTGALHRWRAERSRGMLSLSTTSTDVPEIITPRQIATGLDDHYIIRLNQTIAASHEVVYIRLMAEMNSFYNVYSAFNSDGSLRHGHSTRWYVKAWRRFATIVRGGSVKSINHKLLGLGMPRLLRANGSHARVYRSENVRHGLRHPKVAMVWNPQTISNPDIHANRPAAYWPGKDYVDWVGADIYSKFATPGVKTALRKFTGRYSGFPIAIGEYAPWDNDYRGKFTKWLFKFAGHHPRVRMLVYYRSTTAHNAFSISNYSGARRKLRRILERHRYKAYAPGLAP